MMIRLAALLATLLGFVLPAAAQEVVADLSQRRVSITASFSGSHILVFGAVKHTAESQPKSYPVIHPLDVIITVSGPLQPVTVRKKDRRAGIWINAEAVEVEAAPTLYKIATTGPLDEILTEEEIVKHRISVPLAIRATSAAEQSKDAEAFLEALIRIRKAEGLYLEKPSTVHLADQTLFRTEFNLPANLVEGEYTVRIFLARQQQVVADYTRVLRVHKVGIERWIYNLAQEQALLYGLMSLAIAIAAGWAASAAFRYVRGT